MTVGVKSERLGSKSAGQTNIPEADEPLDGNVDACEGHAHGKYEARPHCTPDFSLLVLLDDLSCSSGFGTDTSSGQCTFFFRQPATAFGGVGKNEPGHGRDDYTDEPFEKEDVAPRIECRIDIPTEAQLDQRSQESDENSHGKEAGSHQTTHCTSEGTGTDKD